MSTKNIDSTREVALSLKSLSVQDFKNFGKDQIAYLRSENQGEKEFFSAYGADGERLGMFQDRQDAILEVHARSLDLVIMH